MNFYTATTEGIRITVHPVYLDGQSDVQQRKFIFAYFIRIENHSTQTVQLTRRHWFIKHSTGRIEEVEGEGVVGMQPVIEPGNRHQYVSGCNIKSDLGKMYGYYIMEQLIDGKEIKVTIPSFNLIVPYLLN